ncbi:MAG TPA: autotransporter domain-containing protein [Povalibacter sp.]|uniref:autotransporter domain-containing protein n=1 Tax=Povalibacter sp. TaxID=1962978 RepID=UPI002BB325E5|nr:autotransporter domain-containing protein [Povalibacter sp.]HMN44567.1 autotransporter domain-containing protein [Povalibacter sp.]
MRVRRPRSSALRRFIAPVPVLAALYGPAWAGPPAITGQPVVGQIPDFDGPLVVNLRQQGVISGSGPLQVQVSPEVIVNGQPTSVLQASVVPNTAPGAVCIQIDNLDFGGSSTDNFAIDITLLNLGQQSAGPQRVTITNTAGPVVDPQDPACNDPNTTPVANAGIDQTIADTNGEPGEPVVLNASATTDADPDNLLTYVWTDASGARLADGVNPTINLPDGTHVVTLTVTDDSFDPQTNTATDTVTITVAAPVVNAGPVANAGGDRTVADTDGQPGENVTLDGSASTDSDGRITAYEWFRDTGDGEQSLGTGATLSTPLPDGANAIRLQVTDDGGAVSSTSIIVTVTAPLPNAAPTANAGPDQSIADSDAQPGELVQLDGSASTDTDGTIVAYDWFLQTSDGEQALGSGATLSVRIPDGTNVVRLQVTDAAGAVSSDTVQITVAAPPERTVLSELPNLTPNQQKMATQLDRICAQLDQSESTLTPEQQELLVRCNGLLFNNSAENQQDALDELNGEDFAVARTQTLLFATQQYTGIMDRLMALRGGAKGLSLAGLNVIVDGKPVPLASIEKMLRDLLGGGASADDAEPGGLLSDRWGLWVRGNYSFGDKEASAASPSFDAEQWSLLAGIDYRLTDNAVLGGSISYGSATIDFNPSGEGTLDTESWAASIYGSMYAAKNFYFDAIVNVAPSSFDARRNITYVDGTGLVTADAHGDTDGMTVSAGLSGGYDFLLGGFTLSPNIGVFYIDATIDGFTEDGAGGLDLMYDEQKFKSLTANAGLRMTYAWKTSWGVVLPQIRADFVREFEDDVNVFGVRFAADPEAGAAPPILVETDNPDTSYWRFAGGLSAQFRYGISGYVEYQRLESFQYINFEDVAIGLRVQHSF